MENQPVLIDVPTNAPPEIPLGFYKNKNRPNNSSPEVLIMVVNKLLSQVIQWGSYTDDEESEVGEQLLNALESERDGYDLAKYLDDRFSWDCDSELVDILDGADFYGAAKTAIKAWIRDNAIVPAFEVGRQVSVKMARQAEMLTGIIRSLTDDGMYCVMIPSEGHVESGLGTHGLLFPWEDVEAWNGAESV